MRPFYAFLSLAFEKVNGKDKIRNKHPQFCEKFLIFNFLKKQNLNDQK